MFELKKNDTVNLDLTDVLATYGKKKSLIILNLLIIQAIFWNKIYIFLCENWWRKIIGNSKIPSSIVKLIWQTQSKKNIFTETIWLELLCVKKDNSGFCNGHV